MSENSKTAVVDQYLKKSPLKIYIEGDEIKKFNSVKSIKKFLVDDQFAWETFRKDTKSKDSKIIFENIIGDILKQIEALYSVDSIDTTNSFSSTLVNIQSQLNSLFPYDSLKSEYFRFLFRMDPSYSQDFYQFVKDNKAPDYSNALTFKTTIYFNYYLQSRKLDTRKSINLLIENIDSQFKSKLAELQLKVREAEDEMKNLRISVQTYLDEEKENLGKISDEWKKFLKDSKSELSDMENLYQEKLRLSAPTQYWQLLASEYSINARNVMMGIILTISSFVAVLLILLFNYLPQNSQLIKDNTVLVYSTITLIITVFSLLIFTLTKLFLSNQHLARDAKEREQLTHVFLALSKDSEVKPEDRSYVLQALFARSDTGLIKSDGVTMPGLIGILESLLKAKR